MNIITIGAINLSESIVTHEDTFNIDDVNTLYHLKTTDRKISILYNSFTGYFEISDSFLQENSLNSTTDFKSFYDGNTELFYEKLLSERNIKYLLYSGSEYEIHNQSIVKKNSENHSKLLEDIRTKAGRGAINWFHYIYRNCFLGYRSQEEIYLKDGGFEIPNFKKLFGYTAKTRNKNFNILKELNLIRFNYSRNKITELTFNINKFPNLKENIPVIFQTAFYETMEIDEYQPINLQLKKIDELDVKLNYEGENKQKIDYTERQINNEIIGQKSEELALKFEIERLSKSGIENAREKAKIVSDNSSLGYDIISIETTLEKRFIEVKTLKTNFGNYSFHITNNELEKANSLKNYYIYLVIYNKDQFKIKIVKANGIENSEYFKVIPTNYKVYIKF